MHMLLQSAMWLVPRRTVSLAPRALRQASLCSAAPGDHERGLRVGVIGLGAIGAIFFTQLSRVALQPQLSGHSPLVQSVEALVKPRRLAELTQQRRVALSQPQEENAPFATLGLKEADGGLETAGGTSRIQTLESEPRAPFDVVLLALKANDSARVIEELQTHQAHRFRRDAVFVLLQNGLGAFPSQEVAANQIDTAYQYANAVTYVGGRVESVGHVVVSGIETEPTYFALVNQKTTATETQGQVARERLRMLSDALVQSGLRSQVLVPHEMQTILWRKLVVNAAINPIAALLNTPNGHVGACEWSRRSVEAVVQEAVAIAEREHVDLQATEQEMVEYVLRVATNTSENVCSTLADLRKGARTEIDALTGQIVRSGKKHGVPTPVNSLLFDLVKALEAQRLRAVRPEAS